MFQNLSKSLKILLAALAFTFISGIIFICDYYNYFNMREMAAGFPKNILSWTFTGFIFFADLISSAPISLGVINPFIIAAAIFYCFYLLGSLLFKDKKWVYVCSSVTVSIIFAAFAIGSGQFLMLTDNIILSPNNTESALVEFIWPGYLAAITISLLILEIMAVIYGAKIISDLSGKKGLNKFHLVCIGIAVLAKAAIVIPVFFLLRL